MFPQAALALVAVAQAGADAVAPERDPAVFDARVRAVHAALCADDAELARERFGELLLVDEGEPYVRERYAELVLLADWIDGWTDPVPARELVDLGARVMALRESSRSIELAYDESGLEDFLAGDAQDRHHANLDPQKHPSGDLFLFPAPFTDDYTVRFEGVRRGVVPELHVAIQPSGERVVVTFEDAGDSNRLIAVQVVGLGQRAPPRTAYVDSPDANSPLLPFELEVEVADGVVTVRHARKPALEVELVGDDLVPGRFGFVAEGITDALRRARREPSFAGPDFDERLTVVRQLFGGLRALEVEGEVDGRWLARTLRGQRLIDVARRRGTGHALELVPASARPDRERPVHPSPLRLPLGPEARAVFFEIRGVAVEQGQEAALEALGESRAARSLDREDRAAVERHVRATLAHAVEHAELARARARAGADAEAVSEASSEALEWLWFLGRDGELEAWCAERLAVDPDDAAAAGRLAQLHLVHGRLDEAEALVRGFHARGVTSAWLLEAGLGVASARLGPVVPAAAVAERASLRLRSDGALQRYAALLDPLAEACARWDALLDGGGPGVHEVWILEDRSTFESLRETILRDRAHRGLILRFLAPSVFPAFESADDVLATPGHVIAWGGAPVASLRQPLLLALARDAVRGRAPHAPDWLVQGLVDYEAERLAEESANPFDTDLYGRMRGEVAATGSLTKLVSGSPWTDDAARAVEALETRRAAGLVAAHLFLASDGDGRAALGALLDAYASGADPSAALVERLGAEGVVRLDRLFSDERLRLADPLRR